LAVAEGRYKFWFKQLALEADQARFQQGIFGIEAELALFRNKYLQQGAKVAAVEAAGMVGHAGGQAIGADNQHPVVVNGFTSNTQLTVAPLGYG